MPIIQMKGHKINNSNMYYVREVTKGVKPYVKPYKYMSEHHREELGRYTRNYYYMKKGDLTNCNMHAHFGRARVGEGPLEQLIRKNMYAGVHNKALSKLDEKLTVASNFFETWYERRELYKMVGQVASELLDFARNFKKPRYWKRKGSKAKAPSTLPEAWLTYQFGIVPLIGTLDTALKGLGIPFPPATMHATSGTTFSGSLLTDFNNKLYYNVKYRKTIGCTVTPNPNPNYALLNLGGLTTPFSTAWSVAPWGWAIDYFINVSELLQNMEMKHPGVTTSDWYETEKFDWSYFASIVVPGGDKSPLYNFKGTGEVMYRNVTAPPNFRIHLDLPLLGDGNKFANLFSALALTMKGKSS